MQPLLFSAPACHADSSVTPTLLRESHTAYDTVAARLTPPKCLTAFKRLYWPNGGCDVSIPASLQDAAGQTSDRSLSGLAIFRD